MTQFRTLDEHPCRPARAGAGRPQRPDRERPGHRPDPDRPHPADDPRDRRQGRPRDPAGAFRPAEGWTGREELAEARGSWPCPRTSGARSPSCRHGGRHRPQRHRHHEGRRRRVAREHPLSRRRGEERPRLHRSTRGVGRHLRQRRVLGRASRPRLDRGARPQAPGPCGRTMQAELAALTRALEKPERPLVAIVGGAKVSTKLELLGNLVKRVDAW